MSKIDYQVLREAAVAIETVATPQKLLAFRMKVTPQVVLALLDERDALNERLAELEADLAGLAEDHQKAIESIKQADAAVKLAHEKFSALAAENAGLNKFIAQSCYVFDGEQDELSDAYICAIDGKMPQTPATDAFLAEIERKAIRKFINSIEYILRDKLSPYDTEEMLEAMRIFLEEQGGEQK
ncbi:TPA: ead/Ea22-like family protein [Escherichia coli]